MMVTMAKLYYVCTVYLPLIFTQLHPEILSFKMINYLHFESYIGYIICYIIKCLERLVKMMKKRKYINTDNKYMIAVLERGRRQRLKEQQSCG